MKINYTPMITAVFLIALVIGSGLDAAHGDRAQAEYVFKRESRNVNRASRPDRYQFPKTKHTLARQNQGVDTSHFSQRRHTYNTLPTPQRSNTVF